MNQRILPLLILSFFTSCTNKEAIKYSEDLIEIVNEMHVSFDSLDSRIEMIEDMLRVDSTNDSLLMVTLSELTITDEKLSEIEEILKGFPDFNGDNELKTESVKYVKSSREEILPIYKKYVDIRLKEYIQVPISKKDNQQLIDLNKRVIESNRKMIVALGKKYRDSESYFRKHDAWLTKR